MPTLRRRHKGPTRSKRCNRIIPILGSLLPARCSDRVYKAGVCRDHWTDDRHASEARWGTQAVNVQRRERRGAPLPKDMSRATKVERWVKPEEAKPETIAQRRKRQGVSLATQNWLMDRALPKRTRKRRVA